MNAAVDTMVSQAPADEGDIACTIARNILFWRAWLVYIVVRSSAAYSESFLLVDSCGLPRLSVTVAPPQI